MKKSDLGLWIPKQLCLLVQIESLGLRVMDTTVPVELAASLGRDSNEGAKKATSGYQRFGGFLLIFTGLIAAYTSGQELLEAVKTRKSEAVEMLEQKAREIETNLRPFEFLRD